jgi:anti-sigma regulatory factor (Ser/Thr protein kinase)
MTHPPYRHVAHPYSGHDDFVSTCGGLVQEALARDERPMLLAVATKLDDVRAVLGPGSDDVAFIPTDEHGRNPSRIVTMLHSFQVGGDGRPALSITETVVPGLSRAALAEARFAEAVLNVDEVRAYPMGVVCLYDRAGLEPADLHEMHRSHPTVFGETDNADFDRGLAAATFATDLAAGPAGHSRLAVSPLQLADMRVFVRAQAAGHGIAADRLDDLVLAANEIVTNSLRHGGGTCAVHVWADAGAVVTEVRDSGWFDDPVAGRLAPLPEATSGRGLWLANHLCDLVQVRSSAAAGTVVRLYVDV